MRFLFFTIGAIILSVIIGLFAAPMFVDPDKYRRDILAELASQTGAEFDIRGQMEFTILPSPQVKARDLRLVTGVPRAEDLLVVDAVQADLSLTDLLSGDVVIENLVLIRPVLSLTVNHAGQANWEHWSTADGAAPKTSNDGLSIGQISISDGTVFYRDARSDTDQQLTQVHLELVTQGGGDQAKAIGTGRYGKIPVEWDVRLGAVRNREGRSLSGRVRMGSATDVHIQGKLKPAADARPAGYHGKLKMTAPNLITVLQDLGIGSATNTWPAELQALSAPQITTDVTLNRDGLETVNIVAETDEMKANGSMSLRWTRHVPDLKLAIAVDRLDLDRMRWTDAKQNAASPDWLAPLQGQIPKVPENLNFEGKFSLGLLKLAGRVSRNIKLESKMRGGVATISTLSAQLPGGGNISVRGDAQSQAGSLRFNGTIAAKTGNFRTWVKLLPGWPAQTSFRLPRSMELTSDLSYAGEVIQVTDIEMQLDQSHVSGGIAIALRKRPSFSTNLKIDRLNLDTYLRPSSKKQGAEPGGQTVAPLALPPTSILSRFDTNSRFAIDRLIIGGTPIRDLAADLTLFGGTLTLRNLTATDEAGSTASISGTLSKPDAPEFSFDLSASTTDPASLGRHLGRQVSAAGRPELPLTVTSHVSGNTGKVKIAAAVKFPDTVLGINGNIAKPFETPEFDVIADGKTAAFGPAIATLFPHVDLPDWMNTEASFQMKVSETAEMPNFAGHLDIAGLRLHTDVSADFSKPDASLTGMVKPMHGELANLLQTVFQGFTPARSELGPVTGTIQFSGTPDALEFSKITVLAGPFEFDGRGNAQKLLGADRHFGLTGIGNNWPLDRLFKFTDVSMAEGAPRWSLAPFDVYLPPLNADVNIALDGLTFAKHDLKQVQLDLQLDRTRITARHAEANYFDGKMVGRGYFAVAGIPELTVEAALENVSLEPFVRASTGLSGLTGVMNAQVKFNAVGISPYDLTSNIAGNGTIAISDGQVPWSGSLPWETPAANEDASAATDTASDRNTGQRPYAISGEFQISEGRIKPKRALDVSFAGRQGTTVGHIDVSRWQVELEHRLTQSGTETTEEKTGRPTIRQVDRVTNLGSLSKPETRWEFNTNGR